MEKITQYQIIETNAKKIRKYCINGKKGKDNYLKKMENFSIKLKWINLKTVITNTANVSLAPNAVLF